MTDTPDTSPAALEALWARMPYDLRELFKEVRPVLKIGGKPLSPEALHRKYAYLRVLSVLPPIEEQLTKPEPLGAHVGQLLELGLIWTGPSLLKLHESDPGEPLNGWGMTPLGIALAQWIEREGRYER